MNIFEKRIKEQETEIPVTQEPSLKDFEKWYNLSETGFRKRRKTKGVSLKVRVLTKQDYGEIFYKCGMPPRLPKELHQWAEELSAAWCRLVSLGVV